MVSATSDVRPPKAVKIVIAGGFGAGKTTLVGSVSEIPPLATEEILTQASEGVDDLDGVDHKSKTTVALDFGRITITEQLKLYLFGTPGQHRFSFMWDDLSHNALGAVAIVDTRRLADSFSVVDFFEHRRIPFVVALNQFEGARVHNVDAVRRALALSDAVPILPFDARDRQQSKDVLIALLEYALQRLETPEPVR